MSKKNLRRIGIALLLTMLLSCVSAGALATDAQNAAAVLSAGSAPIAENLSVSTYKNIAITGQVSAVDPKGEMVTFALSGAPSKGTVVLTGDGTFTYTPDQNKRGKDTFTFTATDASGNVSGEATVTVTILKRTGKLTYSDMEGNSAYYAALRLSEEGIFTGEKLGDDSFFEPDRQVTRGEFLAMCMNLCKVENLSGITRTGFYDDSAIPAWLKPYVSTALVSGAVEGSVDADGNHVFDAASPITYAQALVMLNSLMEITDVSVTDTADAADAWWHQAQVNLVACDIIPSGSTYTSSSALTRADVARLLLGAIEFLDSK